MRALIFLLLALLGPTVILVGEEREGPAAALAYELKFRGDLCVPGKVQCYPEAKGIPFASTENIHPMSRALWTPAELVADFNHRMSILPVYERKRGIIVVLKTERCATKEARLCSVTTAAMEKRSTPLLREFEIYGLEVKPRDNDDPPGSLMIETGEDAWKNDAVRQYGFKQGPGATIVFLDPSTGRVLEKSDAFELKLYENWFLANGGRAPELETMLVNVLLMLEQVRS